MPVIKIGILKSVCKESENIVHWIHIIRENNFQLYQMKSHILAGIIFQAIE